MSIPKYAQRNCSTSDRTPEIWQRKHDGDEHQRRDFARAGEQTHGLQERAKLPVFRSIRSSGPTESSPIEPPLHLPPRPTTLRNVRATIRTSSPRLCRRR